MDCFLSLFLKLVVGSVVVQGAPPKICRADLFEQVFGGMVSSGKRKRRINVADLFLIRDMIECGLSAGITGCGELQERPTCFGELSAMVSALYHKSGSRDSFSRFVVRPDGVVIDIDAYYAAMACAGLTPACALVSKTYVKNRKGQDCGRVLYLPVSLFKCPHGYEGFALELLEAKFGGAIVVYSDRDIVRDGEKHFVVDNTMEFARSEFGWRYVCDMSLLTPCVILSEAIESDRTAVIGYEDDNVTLVKRAGVDISYESFALGANFCTQVGPEENGFPLGMGNDSLIHGSLAIRLPAGVVGDKYEDVLRRFRYNTIAMSIKVSEHERLCNGVELLISESNEGYCYGDNSLLVHLASTGVTLVNNVDCCMVGDTDKMRESVFTSCYLKGEIHRHENSQGETVNAISHPSFELSGKSGNVPVYIRVILVLCLIGSCVCTPNHQVDTVSSHSIVDIANTLRSQISELAGSHEFAEILTRVAAQTDGKLNMETAFEAAKNFGRSGGVKDQRDFDEFLNTMFQESKGMHHADSEVQRESFISMVFGIVSLPAVSIINSFCVGMFGCSERDDLITPSTCARIYGNERLYYVVCFIVVLLCISVVLLVPCFVYKILSCYVRPKARLAMKRVGRELRGMKFRFSRAGEKVPLLTEDYLKDIDAEYTRYTKGAEPMDINFLSFNDFVSYCNLPDIIKHSMIRTIEFVHIDGALPAWFVIRYLWDSRIRAHRTVSDVMKTAKRMMLPVLVWREKGFEAGRIERRCAAIEDMITQHMARVPECQERFPEAKKKLFVSFYNGSGGADNEKGDKASKSDRWLGGLEGNDVLAHAFDAAKVNYHDVEFDDNGEIDERRSITNILNKFERVRDSWAEEYRYEPYWALEEKLSTKSKEEWRQLRESFNSESESGSDDEYWNQKEHFDNYGVFDEGLSHGNVIRRVPEVFEYYMGKRRRHSNGRRRECMYKIVPLRGGDKSLRIMNPKSKKGIEVTPDGVSSKPDGSNLKEKDVSVSTDRVEETRIKCTDDELKSVLMSMQEHIKRVENMTKDIADLKTNKDEKEWLLKARDFFIQGMVEHKNGVVQVDSSSDEDFEGQLIRKRIVEKQDLACIADDEETLESQLATAQREVSRLQRSINQKRKQKTKTKAKTTYDINKNRSDVRIVEPRVQESATVSPVDFDVIEKFKSGIVSLDFGEPLNRLQRGTVVGARTSQAGKDKSIVHVLTVGHRANTLWDESTIHKVKIGLHREKDEFVSGTCVGKLIRKNVGGTDDTQDTIVILRCLVDAPVGTFNSKIMSLSEWNSAKSGDLLSVNLHKNEAGGNYKWTLSTRGRGREIFRGDVLDEVEVTGLNFFGDISNGRMVGGGSSGTPLSQGTRSVCALHIAGSTNSNFCIPLNKDDIAAILGAVKSFL